MVDWAQVKEVFSATHIIIGVSGYFLYRGIAYVLKVLFKAFVGWFVSDERRLIYYLHHKYNHQEKAHCKSGLCYELGRNIPKLD